MIRIWLCALDTIHHTVFNITAKCISLQASKQALKPLWSTLPSMLSSTHPIALDDTHCLLDNILSSKLSKHSQAHSWERSQIHSQMHSMPHSHPGWLYIPKYTLKMLSSTLPSMLSITLSRGKTHPISLDCMLPCMLMGAWSSDWLSCRHQAWGGGWQVMRGGRQVADDGGWHHDVGW